LVGIQCRELGRNVVAQRNLAFIPCFILPGAVTAGTSIPLPNYAKGAEGLIQAIHLQALDHTHDVTHAACGATGAAYPTASPITSTAARRLRGRSLTVVTATPTAGQIQLKDENNIVLGDDTTDEDVLLLILVKKV